MWFFILWYLIGILSLAWTVKFNVRKINEAKLWFYVGALFGPLVLILGLLEKILKEED